MTDIIFHLISKSRDRKSCFKIVFDEEEVDPIRGIKSIAHNKTVNTAMSCIEKSEGRYDYVL